MSYTKQKEKLDQESMYQPNLESHSLCFMKLHDDAVIPTYGTEYSVGLDLVALEDTVVDGVTPVRTGLAVRPPKGFYTEIVDLSSNPVKKGVHLANNIGIIDPDCRGELIVLLVPVLCFGNIDNIIGCRTIKDNKTTIKKGDRIAQLLVRQVIKQRIMEVTELDDTERSSGKFGSTGE